MERGESSRREAGAAAGGRAGRGTWPPPQLDEPRLRLASARLSRRQRRAIASHPALVLLFELLDRDGPHGVLRTASGAAQALGVSRTTLWRLLRSRLRITYTELVGRWRVDIARAVYGRGDRCVLQRDAARLSGFYSVAQMRAHFVRWTGALPTGRAPRERLPLFAGVC